MNAHFVEKVSRKIGFSGIVLINTWTANYGLLEFKLASFNQCATPS